MSADLTIFIIGGYGTFGGRLVALLESDPRIDLIVAGRSLAKAKAFCAERGAVSAKLIPATFDRNGDISTQLASFHPQILVDASGPFQAYGDGRYRVIEACLEQKIHYLDLADGSDFVAGVSAYDAAAREKALFILSGVSSFPVLTAAAVRALSKDWSRIDNIRGGIAPSPFAGVGLNVIRAIAGYAGQAARLKRAGQMGVGYSLTELTRWTIGPPGRLPLHNKLFSLVDVPDLQALSELWPEAQNIWMGAGPVPEILHRLLIGLSWLVRWNIVPSLSPLAEIMHNVTNHLRWGEHRGGMIVEAEGADAAGAYVKRSWHLLAEGEHGPLIPSMAVAAIVQKVLAGSPPPSGARAAIRELELEDYDRLFATRTIYTGIRDDSAERGQSLYPRVLGAAWNMLPAEIRALHECSSASGSAEVMRGRGVLARLAAKLVGFPEETAKTPVSVQFDVTKERETWTRRFGNETFSSLQYAGQDKSEGLLCERFGPLLFAMALVWADNRLTLVLRRWSAFGIPLPMRLCPRSTAYETVEDGRFHFHVEIGHPLTGLIVRYRGWLKPKIDGS